LAIGAVKRRRTDRIRESATTIPANALAGTRPEVQEEILPFCLQKHIGVIVYAPMMSGLLTGKMTRERVASLEQDDWRRGSVVAIAWTLSNLAVTAAIVGGRRPQQVEETRKAGDFRLSDAEKASLDAFIRERQ
jgi:aryl-alcohol dehydrogenase-like predicted oxidoreductase